MYCMKCGAELPDESVFCFKCGHPVPAESQTASAASAEAAPAEPESVEPRTEAAWGEQTASGKKPLAGKKRLLFCLAAAAVFGVLAGLFFLGRAARKPLVLYEAVSYDRNGAVLNRKTLDEGSIYPERSYTTRDSEGNVTGRTTERYNEDRNLLSQVIYDAKGNVRQRLTVTYADGNCTSLNEQLREDGTVAYQSETTNDSKGRLIAYKNIYDGEVESQTQILYEGDGKKPLSVTKFKNDGSVLSRTEYTYDRDGRKTSESEYNEFGNLTSRTEYFCDEGGTLVRETHTSGSGRTEEYTYQNEFGADGKLSRQEKHDSSGALLGWFVYEYPDQSGGYEVTTYAADGRKEESTGYDRDENIIKSCYYSKYDEEMTLIEYDSAGRQTKLQTETIWMEYVYAEDGRKLSDVQKDPDSGEIIYRTEYEYREME